MTKKLSVYRFTIYSSVIVTLAATPNFHKDALIIPKIIILFCSILIILPYLLNSLRVKNRSRILSSLKIISILLVLQLILAMFFSQAPIEQQIFGRTGRGLGFLTMFSLIVITFGCAITAHQNNYKLMVNGLAVSGLLSAVYAVFQSYGLDFFPWDSKTNGVIGTLGNPNFVSSFAAMSVLPALMLVHNSKRKTLYQIIVGLFFAFTVYKAGSYQGYITLILAFSIFILLWLWFVNKVFFSVAFVLFCISTSLAIIGILNKGPLAEILYKTSVQSRGEFWGSAFSTANAHPVFGVGLDSFGDYSLMYRSRTVINEYTDSAHNYLLDFATVAGYPLLILHIILIGLTLFSFFKLFKQSLKFNPITSALFASFGVYQAQSIISPISIPLIVWGSVISGSIIGLYINTGSQDYALNKKIKYKINLSSITLLFLTSFLLFPYFNADRLQLNAMNKGDGDLAIKVAKMFPESVVRYSTLSRALLESGLPLPALDLARSAVEFNPNSPALWALILINPSAPIEERKSAQAKLLVLDPLNKDVIKYEITP
jgi:O-antigen ligase